MMLQEVQVVCISQSRELLCHALLMLATFLRPHGVFIRVRLRYTSTISYKFSVDLH